ncbi:hypothetical protein [Candidatus Clostridium helianthi]|uniref:Uncharacterized protein n=1 Tax=Candidatus Clostridium helianthi TaxID=3381660 RepID=A0ABW8SBW6_9CLOT
MERLRIVIEFSGKKEEEYKLFHNLQKHSNPAAYIKDVLLGLVPIPGQFKQADTNDNVKDDADFEEDLMDV